MSRALILATTAVTGLSVGVAIHAADPATPPTTRRIATSQATATQATTTPVGAARAATTRAVPAATQAAASRPTPPARNEKIEAAIRQLSAESWRQRQAAQDTLVSFGAEAAPRLAELGDTADDEEVRSRAGAALAQIEQNAQFGGTIVTIRMKDAKPQDVFAELGRQARYEFPAYPKTLWNSGRPSQPISIDLERVPFWTAFKEACTKGGVFPQQYGNQSRMSLTQGSSANWNGPSVITGPFMVVANRVHRSESIDLANPAAVQREFQLGLSAFVEPKVRVIQSSYHVRLDEAVDDRGNSLLGKDRVADGMSSGQQWMWNLSARMSYPENAGKHIARIRGGVRFLVQTKAETLDVPDVLKVKNAEKKVAGRRVLIKEVKGNGDNYELQMTVYRDGLGQAEWNAMSYPGYAIRLLDKDGKPLSSRGWGGGGGGTEMNYNWQFGRDNFGGPDTKPGEPHRLVWEIPTETREMTAEFQFKDLPMP